MGFTRRERRSGAGARSAGFNAAVGLLSGSGSNRPTQGRVCTHCGAEGRIDMIDMPRTRAYLTCLECGKKWDTERMDVTPKSAR